MQLVLLYFCQIGIDMNKKIFFLAGLILLLTGCSRATFYPDTLPDACLNQFYEAKIKVGGGTVVSSDWIKYGQVSDENFKLNARMYFSGYGHRDITGALIADYDGNELTVSGTPTSLEPIDVKINVAFYKHMFSFFEPSNGYKKTYTIRVKQCN